MQKRKNKKLRLKRRVKILMELIIEMAILSILSFNFSKSIDGVVILFYIVATRSMIVLNDYIK